MHAAMRRSWWRNLAFLGLAGVGGLALSSSAARADDPRGSAFSSAMELHQESRYVDAAARFILAYAMGERQATSAYNAACALARAGKTEGALVWLERAVDAGFPLAEYIDDDDDLDSLRGDRRFRAMRAALGKHDEIEKVDHKAHKAHKVDKHARSGMDYYHEGRYDEAARAFLQEATDQQNDAAAIYNAACSRSLAGDLDEALDLLERAVAAGFDDPQHLERDDDLDPLRSSPRYQRILALARDLEATPSFGSPWNRNAELTREWRSALPRLEATVQRHPRVGQAWWNVGYARLVAGQYPQAVQAYARAVELGYRKDTSMYNAACASALAGQEDEAFAWLDKALAAGFDDWSLFAKDRDLDGLRDSPRFQRYLELARRDQ